jgi:hypothetical protein
MPSALVSIGAVWLKPHAAQASRQQPQDEANLDRTVSDRVE